MSRWWWVGVMGLLFGCQETSADPRGPMTVDAGETDPSAGLPCDVEAVLRDKCQTCHAEAPVFGAPMPLVDQDDVLAPAKSDPSITVAERMRARIHDVDNPMPPRSRPQLSDEERAALDAWIDDGVAAREEGEACLAPPVVTMDAGPETLPCEISHTFRAHAQASTTDPFAVPSLSQNAGNETLCFTFKSPFVAGEQAVGWAPIVDDDRVLHHYILYSTNTPQVDGAVGPCHMPRDATFLIGWAPGGDNVMMPDDVGLELPGEGASLILQVHYWNAAGYTDAIDSSGVALCTTKTPRPQTAGILWLGSIRIDIPPRAVDHEVLGTCRSGATSRLPGPLTMLASQPHMHRLGTQWEARVLRGGDPNRAETFAKVERWDFLDQGNGVMREPIVIQPGDAIETRCTYANPTDTPVVFGENTENEMCFNFATVYPIDALPASRQCGLF